MVGHRPTEVQAKNERMDARKTDELPPEIIVMADYVGLGSPCCLWLPEGGSGLDEWGCPDELCARAAHWLAKYFEDEPSPAGQTRAEYNAEGLRLAEDVKAFLGPSHRVAYRFISGEVTEGDPIRWETVGL